MPVPNFTPRYKIESPYRATPVVGNLMGYYIHRSIDPQDDDFTVTMDNQRYVGRPDLLAADLYGDPDLWWVFAVRNGLEDPVHDIKLGISLIISPIHYVRSVL